MIQKYKILVTCPPMLKIMKQQPDLFQSDEIEFTCPDVVQTLTETELQDLLPRFDGWIIGDDPATGKVLATGMKGNLKAILKWGAGIDNVDLNAVKELKLPFDNTPQMFGNEVADLAMLYVNALAREAFLIDRKVRDGQWYKPCGISLANKEVALIGFGHIGKCTASRLLSAQMKVTAYDPFFKTQQELTSVTEGKWPQILKQADFLIFTCALTPENKKMLNAETLKLTKPGIRIVNVARGGLIDESALINALKSGQVHSAALDVFQQEPLSNLSPLFEFDQCIFGSHNASNTHEAVLRTSQQAIEKLIYFLKKSETP